MLGYILFESKVEMGWKDHMYASKSVGQTNDPMEGPYVVGTAIGGNNWMPNSLPAGAVQQMGR